MMNEPVELNELIDNPAAPRLWLVHRALQHLPFGEAIERACTAEGFSRARPAMSGARVDNGASECLRDPRIEAGLALLVSADAAEGS
jgi:hypothetical protein